MKALRSMANVPRRLQKREGKGRETGGLEKNAGNSNV